MADDLTGAAEIAGLGWRHGLTAEILHRDQSPADVELVVYDTDSRDCTPEGARQRVARLARRLRRWKPTLVYKKVDSVLRGNVLAEIEAAQSALSLTRCLLVPANPAARRVILNGHYLIRGVPIDQTDFRFDPAHPRRSANVRKLLGASRRDPVTLCKPAQEVLPQGVVVGEAAGTGDVRRWAKRTDGGTLPAGGADFFAALLARSGLTPRKVRGRATRKAEGRTLFVCGSAAESSIRFLNDCSAKDWPVLRMPSDLFAGRGPIDSQCRVWARRVLNALEQHPKVAMGIGQPTLRRRGGGQRLARMLTKTVCLVLARARLDRVCVEGGSTAAALLDSLGWKRLRVDCEFATGVAGLRPEVREGVLLILKPGSYTWPASVLE